MHERKARHSVQVHQKYTSLQNTDINTDGIVNFDKPTYANCTMIFIDQLNNSNAAPNFLGFCHWLYILQSWSFKSILSKIHDLVQTNTISQALKNLRILIMQHY